VSIRLRLAAVFTLAAAVLFAAGSWLFVTALSASLLGGIDAQLAAQLGRAARYVPARAAGSGPARAGAASAPGTAPVTRLTADQAGPLPGEAVIQAIDPAGRVRGGSADAGTVPLLPPAQLSQARHGQIAVTVAGEEEPERVVAAPLPGHPGWVAAAGLSLESYTGTQRDVTRELLIGGLVFVSAAGLGGYGLARAALSPVERMRQEVAAVSARDPAPRIAVPRTRDEIAALAVTMNELLARLQAALAQQRALVADASHELRTPFAVLRGELELAGRPGRSREELATAVQLAAEEAGRLGRITDQLLFLARSDEDRVLARRELADLSVLLAASARHAAARARAAGVTCTVMVPAGLRAELDGDRIREALDNLIDNALRFAPPGTAIEVAARQAGPDLVIEVRDRGPGFPVEFLPHAFERFARPDSGRARSDGGAGLGLAIVSAIVRAHGGQASAANRPDGGAVVTLRLPLAGPG
jgi:signal transduction histidine kinase